MDLTFVLCPNILGLLGLFILLIFTRFNFYLDQRKLKLFISAAIINIAIIIFEVLDYLLGEATFSGAFLWRRITSATGFALTPLPPLLIACISSRRKLDRRLLIPAAANVVMSGASIFTGHLFFIDTENSYFRGPLFYVMAAISVFYLALLIIISFRSIRSIRNSEAIFLLGIALVMVLGNVLEIVFAFHFIIWNSCAVLLITYYLFLHIQFFKFDPLTGVYNRNMYNHEVESLSHMQGVGILSFDLDGLKKVNDTQGHEKGDEYIIRSAKIIDLCFTGAGHLFRVGGDEFVVLMTGTTEQIIRERIASFKESCKQGGVSVACGYSFAQTVADTAQMLREADKAMYENKRNRLLNR